MFIDKLMLLMKENNVSQSKICEELGIGKNQFAYWKKNRNMPSGSILMRLSEYFRVPVSYFLTSSEQQEEEYRLVEVFRMLPNSEKKKVLSFAESLLSAD